MHAKRILTSVVIAASVGFAGCSGELTPRVPASVVATQEAVSMSFPADAGTQIALSDAANNVVDIFGGGGKVNAILRGLASPAGLDVDAHGTLYVANASGATVVEFATPYKSVTKTLNDDGRRPFAVAVAADGTVAASNEISNGEPLGSVTLYARRGRMPCATVGGASFGRIYFAAFDASGNLYIDGINGANSFVFGKIAGACHATAITPISIANTVHFPGGVAVLANGDIAIEDQAGGNNSVIYTYAPPTGNALGAPIATTQLLATGDAVTFAFGAADNTLWLVDATNGRAAKYDYPASGSALKTIPGAFGGVAVIPAQR